MKVFEFLLSGVNQTVALVVAAPTEERAIELIEEEYNLVDNVYEDEDGVEVYRNCEIGGTTSEFEFVKEIFSTDEL